MSNSHRNLLIAIALLLLGGAGPGLLLAKGPPSAGEILVDSATPNFAQQGESNKAIVLAGSNFPQYSIVKFPIDDPKCDLYASDVTVVQDVVKRSSASELAFDINVPESAALGDYDICVYETDRFGTLLGRKGKGTTKLFSVRLRENQNREVDCAEFAAVANCNCRFILDPDTRIFSLIDDCETSETLRLDNARIVGLNGGSNGFSPTLTAVNPDEGSFEGSSVIANLSESAGVRYFNIRLSPGVTRGCGAGINTAISFVLEGDTIDDPERNSFLQVRDMDIDTLGGAPLCTAIEVVREEAFNPQAPGYMDWKINVENSFVADGSYQASGIRLEGFVPQQDINPPKVFGNYIGAPACAGAATAAAIEFGQILLSDPADSSTQVAGVVESNIIRMAMAGCSTPGGAGIWVVGDDQRMTAVEIIKNDISGAFFGVLVDEFVDSAHFTGNTLTGDPSDLDDIGICSGASSTSTKGKPNVWSGYGADQELISDCP